MLNVAERVRNIMDDYLKFVEGSERSNIVAVFLARAISVQLTLPTSPVDSLEGFYSGGPSQQASEIIGALNEAYVLDTKLAMDLVFKFYRIRYSLLFTPAAAVRALMGASVFWEVLPEKLCKALTAADSAATAADAQDGFYQLIDIFVSALKDGSIGRTSNGLVAGR